MLSPSPYAWISQYFLGFFFSYGVYIPFWGLWYEGQGVSAANIGILIGVSFATRCVSNLVITPRLHKVEYLIPALRWLSLGSVLFIAFHFVLGGNFWLMLLATVLYNLCCGPAIPLSDAMANYYSKLNVLDYGRTRLWGSIAFIAGSSAVGYLVAQFGSEAIVWTALAGTAVSLLLSMRLPHPAPVSDGDETTERPKLLALLMDKEVLRFLVLVSLIQGSHATYYSFSSIYWKGAGYSEDIIGYLWSLGVIAEILLFATSKKLLAGWSMRMMFLAASLGVIVRWTLTATTTDLWALALVQMLHAVTFAIAHIAAIRYIQSVPENRMVPLQALYNAIPLGAVMALITTISGWGFERWGGSMFWGMAIMGALALFIRLEPAKTSVKTQAIKEAR
ncbi:3-phenylpropionate MFS transporter [Vibrio albus]|uniref:3-phenylpropionate MFS transporter n=1 Tax=Vibrio albus TaxID=2200953 RepID=A0A2U3BAH9_9VIBR|nr:3-phenylpropionate MFS transporter [Vibrio albus]PWI33790.1 3-phenylpropionate MFS transporter [Vibrio albus]